MGRVSRPDLDGGYRTMTTVTAQRLRTIDVPLGPGRSTIRVALIEDADGQPETLVLSVGFGEGVAYERPPWGDRPLALPAEIMPQLRDALDVLIGGEDAPL
jgi:hypothetical protein